MNFAPMEVRIDAIKATPVYGSWWRWLLRRPASWEIVYTFSGPHVVRETQSTEGDA